MKQYDHAFVPNDKEQHKTTYLLMRTDLPYPIIGLDEVKKSIVLTFDELKEVWDKGYVRGCEEVGAKHLDMCEPTTSNFSEFIKSKGIQTPHSK